MNTIIDDQDVAPKEIDEQTISHMAVGELRWLLYALHEADQFGSHLLGVALEHFESKARVPHLVTREPQTREGR